MLELKSHDKIIHNLYISGWTVEHIARNYGVYKQRILNSLKRTNTPRRKNWARASGDANGRWKGGIRMVKGYVHIFEPSHRLARKDGYIAKHRLLMAKFITNKTQVVHHKDNNKLNNKISNLQVLASNGVHRKLHTKKQQRNSKGRF